MYTCPPNKPDWVVNHFQKINMLATTCGDKYGANSRLTEIADKYKDTTDKTPNTTYAIKHNYTEFYGDLLEKFVGKSPDVLEVGVRWGGSLWTWKDFFGDGSNIYGADIDLKPYRFDTNPQIHLECCNAYSDTPFESQLFDVIIDDGSHRLEDQKKFINQYVSRLKRGGILIIEDIQSVEYARQIVNQFEGNRNKASIVDRTHCVPSLDDVNVIYFNT